MAILPRRINRTWLVATVGLMFAVGASDAFAEEPTSVSEELELPASMLKEIQHGVFIDDWSQAEINAYYDVLARAKRIAYASQVGRARAKTLAQLDRLKAEADKVHAQRTAELDKLSGVQAARQRAFEAQRHRQALKQIAAFRKNPKEFPLHQWLVEDLFAHVNDNKPSRYHGQLVTLHGHIRKLISYEAHENKHGITTLYEAWLYPIGRERHEADDARTNPVVIVCTSIPDGMPTGEKIAVEASVTGFVFRLHGYHSKIPEKNSGGKTKALYAPMILAAKIEWTPPPPPTTVPLWLKGAILGAIALIIVAVVMYGRRDKAAHKQLMRERVMGEDEPTFDHET